MYQAEISRNTPSAFVFVIDQSGSMQEPLESGQSKAGFLADVINKTLYQLVIRCSKTDGVRDYFDVGVLAYSGDGDDPNAVVSGFGGALAGTFVHTLSAIAANPLRVDDRVKRIPDGAGGLVESTTKFPVWFDPVNHGGTPMTAAMKATTRVVADWCDQHPNSYPPTIIHVTDGDSTDGDPTGFAQDIGQITTSDGPCLLFNLHIAAGTAEPIIFPSTPNGLDVHGQRLFGMSSTLPAHLVQAARDKGYTGAGPSSRFFGYRAGVEVIVDFFEIGTRASNIR